MVTAAVREAVRSTKPIAPLVAGAIEASSRRSITIPMKADDRTAVSCIGKGACSPMAYVAPPEPWGSPPALCDQPLTDPDTAEHSARQAERDLARFLENFANCYGAIPGLAPVIERMREAQAMLSRID